jgi:hypothetical protein
MVFLQKVTVCGETGWLVTFNKVNGTENIYAMAIPYTTLMPVFLMDITS